MKVRLSPNRVRREDARTVRAALTPSRSERRRLDREIAKIKPQEGVGLGWRRSAGWRRNKFPVKEPPNVPLAALITESQAVYVRLYPNGEKESTMPNNKKQESRRRPDGFPKPGELTKKLPKPGELTKRFRDHYETSRKNAEKRVKER